MKKKTTLQLLFFSRSFFFPFPFFQKINFSTNRRKKKEKKWKPFRITTTGRDIIPSIFASHRKGGLAILLSLSLSVRLRELAREKEREEEEIEIQQSPVIDLLTWCPMAELGLGLSHTGHTFEAPNRRRCTLELGGNEDGGSGALKGAWKNTSGMGGGTVTRIMSLPLASTDFFYFLFSVSG